MTCQYDETNANCCKTEGLEVVAYLYQHEETGRTGFVDQTQISFGWEQGNPRLKVIAPLVTLASAQAAVAAKQYNVDTWYERFVESEKRITALESALGVAREALQASANVPCYGGHPKQEAALALIDNVLGGNT